MIPEDYSWVARRFEDYAARRNGKIFIGLVNIEVYMDETGPNFLQGTRQGVEWAGVGACVGTVAQWSALSVKWRKILDELNIEYFHFYEFADKRNSSNDPEWPYYGWSDEKRSEFLFSLAQIANEHTISSIAVLVHIPSYYKEIPEWYRQHIKLPHAFCLKFLLESIWGDVEEFSMNSYQNDPRAFSPAAFFFDRVCAKSNPDWYYMINRLFDVQKESSGLPNLVGSLTVADKSKLEPLSPALEAADLVVYRMRQVQEQFQEGYSRPLDEVLSLKFKLHRMDAQYLKNIAPQLEQQKFRIQTKNEYGT